MTMTQGFAVSMHDSSNTDAIDLIDTMAARLEQTRAIVCSVAEQIEAIDLDAAMSRQLSGEIGAMQTQIMDVQTLVELLARRQSVAQL